MRLVIRGFLSKAGHRVTLAATGAEACAALGRSCFDLAIIDLLMPDMDGDEVVRRLRHGRSAQAGLPVLMLTAAIDPDSSDRVEACGADMRLHKPFRRDDLLGAIGRLTAGR
ncbi:response regulator [Paroceanicella profunda]|uniref:Response regulator n=1 Tax=Paroceanicella profunda TaxID=2579971 RepID=A0A5B8FXF9_9RHOB|nr:response regulator [Paroceanicella profunda]QDL91209.1 response regulator [Paroceanicella profunda]